MPPIEWPSATHRSQPSASSSPSRSVAKASKVYAASSVGLAAGAVAALVGGDRVPAPLGQRVEVVGEVLLGPGEAVDAGAGAARRRPPRRGRSTPGRRSRRPRRCARSPPVTSPCSRSPKPPMTSLNGVTSSADGISMSTGLAVVEELHRHGHRHVFAGQARDSATHVDGHATREVVAVDPDVDRDRRRTPGRRAARGRPRAAPAAPPAPRPGPRPGPRWRGSGWWRTPRTSSWPTTSGSPVTPRSDSRICEGS